MRVAMFVKFVGRNGGPWLTDDLAAALAESGASVEVFLLGRQDAAYSPASANVRIRSFPVPARSSVSRGRWLRTASRSYLELTATALYYIIFKRRYDRLVGFSAFFPFFPILNLAKLLRSDSKRVGFVWDFYPIQWEQSGFLRPGFTTRLIRRLERFELASLDLIVVMTPANAGYLERYHPGLTGAVEVGYLWRDVSTLSRAVVSKSPLRVPSEAIVFGGSLTAGRDVDWITHFAKELEHVRPSASVVVVGDGTGRRALIQGQADQDLSNILIVGAMPLGEYLRLLKSCSVGLIVTSGKVDSPSLPSKCLEYMWAELPILAISNESSDLDAVVESTFLCGLGAPFDSPRQAAITASRLLDDANSHNRLGRQGARSLRSILSPATAAQRIIGA